NRLGAAPRRMAGSPVFEGPTGSETLLSILVGRDDLAAADGAEGAPDDGVDRTLDELHATVAEEGVDPARVVAAGREGHVGRAAVVLVGRVPVRGHVLAGVGKAGRPAHGLDRGIRRHGGRGPGIVHAAVGPSRLARGGGPGGPAGLTLPVAVPHDAMRAWSAVVDAPPGGGTLTGDHVPTLASEGTDGVGKQLRCWL